MAVIIKIGKKANEKKVRLEIDARKSLNGDVMIFDHGDIDIVLSAAKNKVVIFPKDTMNDLVYGAQNRLFAHLRNRGLIIPESVQAGSFFGSLEATMETPVNEEISAPKLTLINISSFIDEERPYFENTEAIISMDDNELIHPDKADSTELGEVPQATEKGSIRPSFIRDPYSLSYMYTL
tara:strand:+ start:8521 stop:9060 length:540 start_codon:yes stop_codon:yes gene_type:complete